MNDQGSFPIVMIGGGGHAAVLADILLSQNKQILAVVSPEKMQEREVFSGVEQLYSDEELTEKFKPGQVKLVNGIGMMPGSTLKRKVNQAYLELGYEFDCVIANDSMISPFAKIEQGAQVLSGAVIQTGAMIGAHSTINSGSIVEHDCKIGPYNHVAPRATLCGHVDTGDGVFIGAGAIVIQCLSLANNSIVAAGAKVVDSLSERQIIYPAKSITKR